MKIAREVNGNTFEIELTSKELYETYKEYKSDAYIQDVNYFLDIIDITRDKIMDEDKRKLATEFYDEKLSSEYTNDYAMARTVIPFLRRVGLKCSYNIKDFEGTSYLNCI